MNKEFYTYSCYRTSLVWIGLFLLLLTACIGEDENDTCGRNIIVKFKYDYNMKFADAFNNEVHQINLYVFDEQDVLVSKIVEEGEALKSRDYFIELDLEPGTYHLVAWGGLTDVSFQKVERFIERISVCEKMTVELQCTDYLSDCELESLWHAETEVMEVPETGSVETTLSLVKNTNLLRVVLHQIDGLEVTDEDFSLQITDDNTLFRYNNDLIPNGGVTYIPYSSGYYTTSLRSEATSTAIYYEIHGSRLMDYSEARLQVTRTSDQAIIIDVPLIDYLLLTEMEGHRQTMSEQEYLDRQDEYSLMFFLDNNLSWLKTEVIINGWTVRFNNGQFK